MVKFLPTTFKRNVWGQEGRICSFMLGVKGLTYIFQLDPLFLHLKPHTQHCFDCLQSFLPLHDVVGKRASGTPSEHALQRHLWTNQEMVRAKSEQNTSKKVVRLKIKALQMVTLNQETFIAKASS